ncbi:hypothetical protein FOL47_000163 [Perkinsus chesapeaki]|uniref:RCC1-like domain-containing protein n=1 Tax=Perkinsus chesapeaki TaxID=330153 RepID=A0A7J6MMD8_PERCH|nr:hypothetical protein FOL47_000163 [Perkinsus chesapeaki]
MAADHLSSGRLDYLPEDALWLIMSLLDTHSIMALSSCSRTLGFFGTCCDPRRLIAMLIEPVFGDLPIINIAYQEMLSEDSHHPSSILRVRLLLERLQYRSSAAAGSIHSAYLRDGQVYTFGAGTSGQLGHGILKDEPHPRRIIRPFSGISVAAVACGDRHTLFLSADGAVFGTGRNTFGQLACRDLYDFPSPRFIDLTHTSARRPVDVRCGGDHSMVLLANGHVVAFGWNAFGQLGIGASPASTSTLAAVIVPTLVKIPLNDVRFVRVACGFAHSLFLTDSGRVFSCGMGSHGQLGNGLRQHRWVPTPIPGIKDCLMVSCGGHHSLLLCGSKGEVYAFGSGSTGKLGRGDDMGDSAIPVKISGQLPPVSSICCGGAHSLVVTTDNSSLYAFGMGRRGQLGDGQRRSHPLPVGPVAQRVRCVAGGGYHTLAVSEDLGPLVFGRGTRGQLGLGFVEDIPIPARVPTSGNSLLEELRTTTPYRGEGMKWVGACSSTKVDRASTRTKLVKEVAESWMRLKNPDEVIESLRRLIRLHQGHRPVPGEMALSMLESIEESFEDVTDYTGLMYILSGVINPAQLIDGDESQMKIFYTRDRLVPAVLKRLHRRHELLPLSEVALLLNSLSLLSTSYHRFFETVLASLDKRQHKLVNSPLQLMACNYFQTAPYVVKACGVASVIDKSCIDRIVDVCYVNINQVHLTPNPLDLLPIVRMRILKGLVMAGGLPETAVASALDHISTSLDFALVTDSRVLADTLYVMATSSVTNESILKGVCAAASGSRLRKWPTADLAGALLHSLQLPASQLNEALSERCLQHLGRSLQNSGTLPVIFDVLEAISIIYSGSERFKALQDDRPVRLVLGCCRSIMKWAPFSDPDELWRAKASVVRLEGRIPRLRVPEWFNSSVSHVALRVSDPPR